MSFVYFLCDEEEAECVKYLTILQEEEYEEDEVSGYAGPEATSQIDETPTESHIVPWEPDEIFFTFI